MNLQRKYIKYKTKYLRLKNKSRQIGGSNATYQPEGSNKIYSGAGVLLVQNYNHKPTVILFKSKRQNGVVYEDLGGGIEKKDLCGIPLASTAIREAFEESRGLVCFGSPDHLTKKVEGAYVDNQYHGTYYRCYIIAIPPDDIFDTAYNHNRKNLDRDGVPDVMKETDGIKRFYLSDLVENVFDKNNFAIATDQTKEKIYERSINVIKKAYDEGIIDRVINLPQNLIQLTTLLTTD